jgi:hypothetical protein
MRSCSEISWDGAAAELVRIGSAPESRVNGSIGYSNGPITANQKQVIALERQIFACLSSAAAKDALKP